MHADGAHGGLWGRWAAREFFCILPQASSQGWTHKHGCLLKPGLHPIVCKRLTLETCKAVCERECNHVGAAAVCERESTCALSDQLCDHVLSVGWGPQTVNGVALSTFFLQGTASWGQGARWLWRCDRVTPPHFSNPLFSLKELKTKGADQHSLSVGGTGAKGQGARPVGSSWLRAMNPLSLDLNLHVTPLVRCPKAHRKVCRHNRCAHRSVARVAHCAQIRPSDTVRGSETEPCNMKVKPWGGGGGRHHHTTGVNPYSAL